MAKLSPKKKLCFIFITFSAIFCVLNVVTLLFVHKTVFWDNPLMVIYPVKGFDINVTAEKYNRNSAPSRIVRYVPDQRRWYRLDPEPTIPAQGRLILNFGDSSTWGWGLADRKNAYSELMNEILSEKIHSINLGVPGYSSLQGLKYVEELLPRYHDRIVAITLYFGNNDSTENGSSDEEKLRVESEGGQQLTKLPLLRLVRDAISTLKPRFNRQPRVNPIQFELNLRKMIELATFYKIPVVLIEPPVNLSWPSAHLTHPVSLSQKIHNSWVKRELRIAKKMYHDGQELLAARNDEYEKAFQEALEHDWVVPRIKKAWLEKMDNFSKTENVTVVKIPNNAIEADSYAFEDYCHPSAIIHRKIAFEILRAINGHVKSTSDMAEE